MTFKVISVSLMLLLIAAQSGCTGKAAASSPISAPSAQPALAARDFQGVWKCGRASISEFRDSTVTMTTDAAETGVPKSTVRASFELQGSEMRMTIQTVRVAVPDGPMADLPSALQSPYVESHPDLVTVDRISNFNGTAYHYERVALYKDGQLQPEHSSIGTGNDCVRAS